MSCLSELSGSELVALASLVSISISKGLSSDELNTLSGFFSAIGDNLAILASS